MGPADSQPSVETDLSPPRRPPSGTPRAGGDASRGRTRPTWRRASAVFSMPLLPS